MLNPKLIGEEVLGAELIASRELTAAAGSLWEAIERAGQINRQQLELWLRDYTQYASDVAKQPDPAGWSHATLTLAGNRVAHTTDGWRALTTVISSELAPICKGWSDFFTVVRRDWQQ